MPASYVDRCAVCACSSLRDEGGRRPVPALAPCSAVCPCHDSVPSALARSARASASALSNDGARSRLFRRRRAQAGVGSGSAR